MTLLQMSHVFQLLLAWEADICIVDRNRVQIRLDSYTLQQLVISAHLKTPLIFQGHMTLDALLGSVLFDQLEDVEAAHSAIPIRCVDDLFFASSVNVETTDRTMVSFAAGLHAQHDLNPSWIKKSRDGTKLHTSIGLKRRRNFGNVLSSYPMHVAEKAFWYCTGDEDRIAELLSRVFFIGKKRSQGFGEVLRWEIDESDCDGLTDNHGNPLRPIPVSRLEGRKDLVVVDAAWKPAYWEPKNRAACYAPKMS